MANAAAAALLDHSEAALIGQQLLQMLPPEAGRQRLEHYIRVVETGNPVQIEVSHWRKAGQSRLKLTARPWHDGLIITIQDTSDYPQSCPCEPLPAPRSGLAPAIVPSAVTNDLKTLQEQEQALNRVIQAIHNSLDLTTIFATAVAEVATYFQVDRVDIRQYLPSLQLWRQVAVSDSTPTPASIGDGDLPEEQYPFTQALKHFQMIQANDSLEFWDAANHPAAPLFPGAWLIVPLQIGSILWGCLGLVKSQPQATWKVTELEIADVIARQLAIAIQQSELYHQVQKLNSELERQVKVRTAQLQLAYEAEATLKRITDRVRDSLDEDQILQTVVQELAVGLEVVCCNAAIFDLEQGTSTIRYEYTTSLSPSQGRVSRLADFPELYNQLLEGHYFQFCSLLPHPRRGRVAMLTCPIQDDQGVMGDLWLIHHSSYAFNPQDIRLVQQVANQCAIALRQARLYRAAQTQVEELERLNHLKDDFLSTVSHELRTPVCNIKLAIQMLKASLVSPEASELPSPKVAKYLQILQDECQREISLINDLLDLSRLEAETGPLTLSVVDLQRWLPSIAHPFRERAQNQQQQQFELQIEAQLPTLTTDLSYLERVMAELLNNACKYTPAGGTIRVSASCPSGRLENSPQQPTDLGFYSPLAATASLDQSAAVLISITNTGIEIPTREFSRIFEKFYRIPNNDPWKYGGVGLGLALVKYLVARLGADIQVRSTASQTTFAVKFPLEAPLPASNQPLPRLSGAV